MAKQILFVSGEVAPYTKTSESAQIVRHVPERLSEEADASVRIMMPRYGIVSERRNRLHEVIRLSGTEIPMGERVETLKVKVASIPGIRLQVYFTDNAHYFKRKGIYTERKTEKLFADNAERALFFARAVAETTRNLGWAPEVVHAFGWISSLLPHVLRTEYADDPLFADAKVVYTPAPVDFDQRLTTRDAEEFGLDAKAVVDRDLESLGRASADATILPPSMADDTNTPVFPEDVDGQVELACEVYETICEAVPA